MAAQKSAYLRSAIVQHALGIPAYAHSGFSTYLALYTSDPTINNTGTEVAGGSYARQQLSWGTESGGNLPSNTQETFTLPTCTVTHWGILDASSGGNLLYFGAFAAPIPRTAGQTIVIESGNIQISEA